MKNPEDDNDETTGSRSSLDRRNFGKILVAGVGALTLGPLAGAAAGPQCNLDACTDWLDLAPRPELYTKDDHNTPFTGTYNVHVVVVGAGLSGLVAARELKKANRNITVLVLEAGDRIGGRMYGRKTNEVAGGHSGYVDYGGQWVGPTQYHMQDLVTDLGIEHFDSYEEGRSIQSWNGALSGFDGDVSHLLLGCTPPAASQYPGFPVRESCRNAHGDLPDCVHNEADGAAWRALLNVSNTVPPDRPWATPGLYDQQTFAAWLKAHDAPDNTYRRWLSVLQSHIGGSGGFEPDQVSALHMAWTQKVGPQSETPEKWLLLGGAGQIPKRIADDLIADNKVGNPIWRIVLNAPVSEITQDVKDGALNVVVKGSRLTINARTVIVAIPPPLRARIKFSLKPDLPEAHTGFAKCSRMGSMSKVHAVYDTAFWRDQCLSGSFAGNLRTGADEYPKVCEFIADSSPPGGKPGILTSFIAAGRNRELGNNESVVKPLVLADYVHFFGEQAGEKHLKDWVYWDWNDKHGTCGAFTTNLAPNVWTSYGEVGWRSSVNERIFWAGTEASDEWPGYFDGAVKAGVTAALAAVERL
jgi:L-amino acid dehydrogenase